MFLLCVSQELCFLVGLFRGSWFLWNPGVPESVTHVANEKLMPIMLNDMSRSQRGRVVPQCPHQPAQQQLLGPALSRSLKVNVFQVFMHVTLTSLYIELGLCVVGLPWCPCSKMPLQGACDPVPVEPDVEVFEGREIGTSFAERVGHVVLCQRG